MKPGKAGWHCDEIKEKREACHAHVAKQRGHADETFGMLVLLRETSMAPGGSWRSWCFIEAELMGAS
ncbi:MAG: hypothetical protein KDA80_15030 [Planctomycetaceae bacterium]|nr:hypothetical protein [Planctomycetaceae bacterium]